MHTERVSLPNSTLEPEWVESTYDRVSGRERESWAVRGKTAGRERESWAVREMTAGRERESWAVREITAKRERAGL